MEVIMKTIQLRNILAMVFLLSEILTASTAMADEKHRGKAEKNDKKTHERYVDHEDRNPKDAYGRDRHVDRRNLIFSDQHRTYIHDYYARQYKKGHCPPGLAKKHNGCQPPGQTRKWAIGQRLPRDVIFYDLPQNVLAYLGPPPTHHRFVRVAQDILLIAVGTGMVVDAIDNLSWEFNR
jgi:Ni/Co efflux regulator RcnB